MSSESATITCPECHTAQREDAPFCDNCGFRLGRVDTAQEGHPAVPKRPHTAMEETEREHPAVTPQMLADESRSLPTAIEGIDAVPSDAVEESRTDSTEVEGVSAVGEVPTEPRHEPVPPTVRGQEPYAPPEADASASVVAPSSDSRTVPWLLAWIASLVAVAMVTAYYVRRSSDGASSDAASLSPAGKVNVAAGSFPRGLDESVRSFILMSCLKIADDSDECEQEELLAGEYPEREVALDAFEIDVTEVTVADWAGCVAAGDCPEIDERACKVYTHQGLQISLRVPKSLEAPGVAVTCVTRAEASRYCEHVGGRLPTNDEWERAARGTDGRIFPWGSTWDPTAANWGETDIAKMPVMGRIDGFEWVAPPGQYPDGVSPSGAHDMAGNVAEWVSGDGEGIARGGSWTSNPFDLRTTGRLELEAEVRRTDVGFRCVY